MPPVVRARFPAPLLLLACVAACLAVTSQSFWIDETQTALKAIPPTLHGWWQALDAEHNSNMQLPLYMVHVWAWARLFGVSEISLRAANIPFFLLGFFAIYHFLRRQPGLRNAALLIYCLHPFVWYYLNEARPYIVQLSGALLASGALFAALEQPEEPLPASWWWLFGAGIVILCGSGILGIPWAAAISVLLIAQPGVRRSIFRSGLPALLVFIPILVLLALYFAWTLGQGARPGETGMNLSSIPFVFYEHLGFGGLGPGRSDMRSAGLHVFLLYLPSLCLLGAPLAYAFACAGVARFGMPPGRFRIICLTVLIPTAFVFSLGFVKHFLVLGRHLTPLFAFVLCAEARAVLFLWNRRRFADRAAASLIVVALALSALECRFAYRHQKEDDKGACAIAKAALAQGEDVWWVADAATAAYYGLPGSKAFTPGAVLLMWKFTPAQLAGMKPPALIVLSKPDLFDPNLGIRAFIRQHGYVQVNALPAFSFWRR